MRLFSTVRIGLITMVIAVAGLVPALASADIYWASFYGHSIGNASVNGTGATPDALVLDGGTFPYSMASTRDDLLWYEEGTGRVGSATPALVFDPATDYLVAAAAGIYSRIAAGPGAVYASLPAADALFSSVTRFPGGDILNFPYVSAPAGIAVTDDYVYWADVESIRRAGIGGSDPTTLIPLPGSSPDFVAVRAPYVYWGTPDGNIGRARLDGSEVNTTFISGLGAGLRGIAVTGSYIYWADFTGNAIGRARSDGSGVEKSFVSAPGAPAGITVLGVDLALTRTGTGAGRVTSQPLGIDCAADCSATFDPDASVTLAATPAAGSVFGGWSGDCSGAGVTCVVRMDADHAVTARFEPASATPGGGTQPAAPLPTLKATGRLRGRTFTSRGTVPSGATVVRLAAASGNKARTGSCRITRKRTGTKVVRTFACTITLQKGSWSVSTTASAGSTAIARAIRAVRVKR